MNNTKDTVTYEEFQQMIVKGVSERLEEGRSVEINEVVKNNGVILKGLTFRDSTEGIRPTIYLGKYYDQYKEGMDIPSVVSMILEVYRIGSSQNTFDIHSFTDFDKAKERIVFKLVNYDKNKVLLSKVPHRPFLDMAVVYYYLLKDEDLENATILIYNNHLESWGITAKELDAIAIRNTPLLLKEDLRSVTEVLMHLMARSGEGEKTEADLSEEDFGMYVLSNRTRIFGAACILYAGVLKSFAEKLHKDLFILPSSVHEVILVPKEESMEWEKLQELVQEVNSTQVEDVEILSDSVYCYTRSGDSVLPAWAVA